MGMVFMFLSGYVVAHLLADYEFTDEVKAGQRYSSWRAHYDLPVVEITSRPDGSYFELLIVVPSGIRRRIPDSIRIMGHKLCLEFKMKNTVFDPQLPPL